MDRSSADSVLLGDSALRAAVAALLDSSFSDAQIDSCAAAAPLIPSTAATPPPTAPPGSSALTHAPAAEPPPSVSATRPPPAQQPLRTADPAASSIAQSMVSLPAGVRAPTRSLYSSPLNSAARAAAAAAVLAPSARRDAVATALLHSLSSATSSPRVAPAATAVVDAVSVRGYALHLHAESDAGNAGLVARQGETGSFPAYRESTQTAPIRIVAVFDDDEGVGQKVFSGNGTDGGNGADGDSSFDDDIDDWSSDDAGDIVPAVSADTERAGVGARAARPSPSSSSLPTPPPPPQSRRRGRAPLADAVILHKGEAGEIRSESVTATSNEFGSGPRGGVLTGSDLGADVIQVCENARSLARAALAALPTVRRPLPPPPPSSQYSWALRYAVPAKE